MKVDLLSSITWSKMTWQPQRLSSARYHLVCLGAILPMGCTQPVTTQGRDTKVGHSWKTHGSSDDDFGLRATEDSSQLCWPFLSAAPKLLPTNCLSFFPLSFTLGQTCIVVGWVSSFFSSLLPNLHFLVFPLFPEQFNPIFISAYLIVRAMVFPVVMYGCDSWTLKKAEHWRIDVFELWCWRRLLRVPWTARRSNQSILKEIGPGCSLEGMMLKLKLQYFGHLIWTVDSLEKALMLGGIWGQEEKGTTEDEMAGWHDWLHGHEFGWTPGVGDGQGGLACCSSWGYKESDTTEWLNWTEGPKWTYLLYTRHFEKCCKV